MNHYKVEKEAEQWMILYNSHTEKGTVTAASYMCGMAHVAPR